MLDARGAPSAATLAPARPGAAAALRREPHGPGFARFMQRRGRCVFEAEGAYWHEVPGRMLMSFPYHLTLEPEPEGLADLLRRARAAGLRYLCTSRPGVPGGLYVVRDKHYDLRSVRPRQRTKVRGGLRRCEIRPLEPKELLTQGLRLNLDTLRRQRRYDAEFADARQWMRFVEAARRSPEVLPFGAFFEGRLAAYNITLREAGWVHILHQMSRADLLAHHPNHALTFAVTQRSIQDPEIECVSFGLSSLVGGDVGLHAYKIELGYGFEPRNSVIQFHPVLRPLLENPATRQAARGVRQMARHNLRLEYVTAVLLAACAGRATANDRGAGATLPRKEAS